MTRELDPRSPTYLCAGEDWGALNSGFSAKTITALYALAPTVVAALFLAVLPWVWFFVILAALSAIFTTFARWTYRVSRRAQVITICENYDREYRVTVHIWLRSPPTIRDDMHELYSEIYRLMRYDGKAAEQNVTDLIRLAQSHLTAYQDYEAKIIACPDRSVVQRLEEMRKMYLDHANELEETSCESKKTTLTSSWISGWVSWLQAPTRTPLPPPLQRLNRRRYGESRWTS